MIERPFQHIVRIRSTDDLQYVNPDVMDEVTINANQLENDIESAAVFPHVIGTRRLILKASRGYALAVARLRFGM